MQRTGKAPLESGSSVSGRRLRLRLLDCSPERHGSDVQKLREFQAPGAFEALGALSSAQVGDLGLRDPNGGGMGSRTLSRVRRGKTAWAAEDGGPSFIGGPQIRMARETGTGRRIISRLPEPSRLREPSPWPGSDSCG